MMPPRRHLPEANESWLMSYADMITLLLCFFIIFIATSEPKQDRLAAAARGMQEKFGTLNLDSPFDSFYRDVQGLIATNEAERFISIRKTESGVEMELSSFHFFLSGGADIPVEAEPLLQEILETLQDEKLKAYSVEVQGHVSDETSPVPYIDGWQLSAARAASIASFFERHGLSVGRLKISAFGAVQPVVPNRDAGGNAIPENQARNERVVILVEKKAPNSL